ncbi:chemotaxis protein CheW [Natronococcus pandeyae]|uniref:Chemotaxis protein CheW n=1 Tax=Natronococcus pandeyae TaxID=2055836 RepID=A0A8J8TPR5_9EURY|nr:chemotaxis protein CheW [Natronococcus pandeyae]TYL37703.1 chemotaxis protein CheW [Natronococcus pandeyae]
MTAAQNRDDGADDETTTLLTFTLAENQYAVAVDAVASVLGVTNDRSLEESSDPWNAGTVTAAGERVRVVDLARILTSALRTTARVDEPQLLVFAETDEDGTRRGWLVDDVDAARTVRTSALERPRTATTTRFVEGRLELAGEEVVWLDERAING